MFEGTSKSYALPVIVVNENVPSPSVVKAWPEVPFPDTPRIWSADIQSSANLSLVIASSATSAVAIVPSVIIELVIPLTEKSNVPSPSS